MDKALEFIKQALVVGAKLIAVGKDAAPLAKLVYDSVASGKEPTDADWDQLKILEKQLRDDLQRPLPADGPDFV